MELDMKIDWDNVRILDSEGNQQDRMVREACRIHQLGPSLNRDCGLQLSRIYTRILPRSEDQSTPRPAAPLPATPPARGNRE